MEGLKTCDYAGRTHFPTEIAKAVPKEGLTLEEVELLKKDEKKKLDACLQTKVQKEEPNEDVSGSPHDDSDSLHADNSPVKKEDDRMEVDEDVDRKGFGIVKKDLDMVKKEEKFVGVVKKEDLPDIGTKKEKDVNIKCEEGDNEPKVKKQENEDDPPLIGHQEEVKKVCEVKDEDGNNNGGNNNNNESVDKDLVATGLGLIPGQYLRPEHVAQLEKLSFSILPRPPCRSPNLLSQSCTNHLSSPLGTPKATPTDSDSPLHPPSPFVNSNGSTTPLNSGLTPTLQNSLATSNMSHKELLEKLHQTAEALPIPPGKSLK